MSLANKYRPKTFDEMIWQEHIIDILKAQMQSRDVVHHNYLLFWPRGTWKTSSARLIAKALNCLDLQNWNPCNHCANCELINNWTSLDYVEIDAASHTWVDNIREEIIDKASYPPTTLNKKIYVIDEVHMLSKWAFNALLKTIEEPKWNVCFIFATTEIHKVPDTIISRCQVFNYKKVSDAAMVAHLENICKQENLQYTESALKIISNISEWCVRDAVKYVDQVSILWDLNEENVARFLGVAWESIIKEILQDIKEWNREKIFSKLDNITWQWIDLSQFAKQSIGYLDQHLLEDTDFYLKCSELFWNIISTIRWYPYPIIAYKIAINKFLSENNWTTQTIKTEQKPAIEISSNTTKEPKDNWASQKVAQEIQTTPAIEPQKQPEVTEEKVESKPQETTSEEKDFSWNFKELREKVLWKMWKPTAQSMLKDQAIIEKKEGNILEITVITPFAKTLINNEENKKILEQLLSTELKENITINTTYIKKEDYLAQKMWL